jgi:hypothetical protein
MKQISILFSYVFDDYLKTYKLLGIPSPMMNNLYVIS